MRPSTAPGRGWSVLGLALAWAALGTLFGVLNRFEPAGSVAFWFNLVTPWPSRCPARCWSATGPPTRSAGFSPRWASPRGSRCSSANMATTRSTNPGSVPGGVLALWLSSVVWFPRRKLVPLLFLLFPDGSLPSPRWRPVARVAVASMAVEMLAVAFRLRPDRRRVAPGTPQNPVGIESAGQVLEFAEGVGFLVTPALAVVALLAPVRRFRRARGVERQPRQSGSPAGRCCWSPGERRCLCP